MKISIIIPAKNELRNIKRCLSICLSQNCKFSFEIIVIDSGSTDGTIEVIQKFPVRLINIEPEQFHHSKTRNMGAEVAIGDILVFLNGDAYPADNKWLSALIANFNNDNVAAVYGKQIPPSNINPVNKFRMKWNYGIKKKLLKIKIYYQFMGLNIHTFFQQLIVQ